YYQNHPDREVEAIVIHFRPDCVGRDFLNLPETYLLPKLFEKARKGMKFTGKARTNLVDLMHQATVATSIDRLIILLSILKTLAETEEYSTIASAHAFFNSSEMDTARINKVCTYTLSNYKQEISLEQIASIANLSVTSFC